MPELPEVETIRRDLEREVVGKRIKSVEITQDRSIRRRPDRQRFVDRLEGAKIGPVRRRGKYLLFDIGDGDLLVVHLGMSGQLLKAASRDPLPKHAHVVLTFTQGGQLRFVDPRTFGEVVLSSTATLTEDVPELDGLGFDPVEDIMSWQAFGARVLSRKVKLKALLMDQRFVAGLGNIYSDEILFTAGLRPERSSDSLTTQEVRRLARAIPEVLHDAIRHRGSSLADQQYRDLHGQVGSYQKEHNVYAREGQRCRRCRGTVVRRKWGGRSTFLCESCQV